MPLFRFKGFAGIGEGQSTLFLFPEWMTGQAMPNYTEDPMLLNFPSSNDTDLLVLKPMVVNLGMDYSITGLIGLSKKKKSFPEYSP